MTNVMQRCVPVSTGTLEPDLRVNYQFGLVLGVDEFEQEDLYFRTRDERAARSLHGHGTAVGLHVTAARPVVAPDDVEVRIEPGVAVDQFGRPVVIATAQCARIGAWLAAQEEAAAAASDPSPLAVHLRPSGDLTLYVVAEYAECADALVPLPGNACGTDDDVTAPSRLRDSWQLGFRFSPPPMPNWDGVRDLADLLLPLELDDGSPITSDEEALAQHIRALAPGAPAPLLSMPAVPRLPRLGARAALDRLLTLWVTEVRPLLAPDLIEPAGEAAVLLSTITVVPAAPFDRTSPAIDAYDLPDDEGRPYLAPTQLIQELVSLGGGAATILAGSPVEVPAPALPVVELATFDEAGRGAGRALVLWNHLPVPLLFGGTVDVSRNGGAPLAMAIAPAGPPNLFRIQPAGGALGDGELLEVRLDLTRIRARDAGAGVDLPLDRWLATNGLQVAGRSGDTVRLFHTMAATAPDPLPVPPPPPQKPVRKLVTATPVLVDRELTAIEVWFHVDKEHDVDDERVKEPDPADEPFQVFAEVEGRSTPVFVPVVRIPQVRHNVFQLLLDQDVWKQRARSSPFLRVRVRLDRIGLENLGDTPIRLADALGVVWEDANADGQEVGLWVRMTGAAL